MALAPTPSELLATLSGVGMVALGAVCLRLSRLPAPLGFGIFAVLWGAQIVAASIYRMYSGPAHDAWFIALTALFIPLYIPLLAGLAFLLPIPTLASRPYLIFALALPGIGLLLLFLTVPGWFFISVPPTHTLRRSLVIVSVLNGLVLFVGVAALLAKRLATERAPSKRDTLALLLAAFSCYACYQAVRSLMLVGPALQRDPALAITRTAISLLALTIAVWVVARSLRDTALRWRGLLLAATILPISTAVLEFVLLATSGVEIDTLGIWRLAMVAIFAYAVVRLRMFDVEVRLKEAAPALASAAVIVVLAAIVWALGASISAAPLLTTAALAGIALIAVPIPRLTRAWLDRAAPHVQREDDYLYKRKLEVYRAALEEAEARGAGEKTEQHFLSELRKNLGIGEAEHRVLLLVLRSQERFARPPAPRQSQFRIERELGRGSFGRALLARDTVLDRPVVLKQPLAAWVLDAQGRERFLQEARLAARVKHPHVVTVYGVDATESPPVIVMEYVEGGSLQDRLDRVGRLGADEALALTLDVLDGLAEVHRAGIVHRDLKPANILLDSKGSAKVTDFGIAQPPADLQAATVALGQAGSLAYMAPEQVRGEATDARADLYAVGVTLYRMLTGRHYLDVGKQSEAKVRMLIEQAPPRLPAAEISLPLEAVLLRALDKDPARRFASADEMREAVRATLPLTGVQRPVGAP